jgi:predicted TIM-barrel fold metal-dependent hydrolase
MHTHAISEDVARYPMKPLGGERSSWSEQRPVTIEQLIESQDQAGISKAALVQASTAYGFDNSYVADALDRYPGRFVGVASVDFVDADAVSKLDYWIRDRGLGGVRIRAADGSTRVPTPGSGLDDPTMNPVWEYLEGSRVPVCVQMHSHQAPNLVSVLERFPNLIVALDHGARPRLDGGPPYDGAEDLFVLTRFENVFLKLTSVTVRRAAGEPGGDPAKLVRKLVDGFGANRVTWGSNFPASDGSLAELRRLAEDAFGELTDTERRQVSEETPKEVYPTLAT